MELLLKGTYVDMQVLALLQEVNFVFNIKPLSTLQNLIMEPRLAGSWNKLSKGEANMFVMLKY